MRDENSVISDLSNLCKSKGYIHVIAYFCARDNYVYFEQELKSNELLNSYSYEKLIRTEISTLIGFMVQEEITYNLPCAAIFSQLSEQTVTLLNEFHSILSAQMRANNTKENCPQNISVNDPANNALREPIFYGGESAYRFQYRDFSPIKYSDDDSWLIKNKGFSTIEAREVVYALLKLQEQKLLFHVNNLKAAPDDNISYLPPFVFTITELSKMSGLAKPVVQSVISAFTFSVEQSNSAFKSVNDFNLLNSKPIIKIDIENYVLLQAYSLSESLYESPYYWMIDDKEYINTAMQNRGRFTENFCRERMEHVFGKSSVHTNVNMYKSRNTVGEIDVLVIFGDRALILQAKSKRLSIEARRGNDGAIKSDFKKSVQDSYAQGLSCARSLLKPELKLVDTKSHQLTIPKKLKEIYIVCVVSDHYPALFAQTQAFLKHETDNIIQPPFVLDIFALDTITEMLDTPLLFLSYINRRVRYSNKILATHEHTVLSYHLKLNLWIDDQYTFFWLTDDLATDLDIAMEARRDGASGEATPEGLLTRFKTYELGQIIKQIELQPEPMSIDLGLFLLTMSEDAVQTASKGISAIASLSRQDKQNHDLTIGFESSSNGFTIHCNNDPTTTAIARLDNHCFKRKYSQRANEWFGICIDPTSLKIRFCLKLDFPWVQDSNMDLLTKDIVRKGNNIDSESRAISPLKLGRNSICPCGSGFKYKHCCLNRK